MPQRPPWPAAALASPLLLLALQGCASPMTSSDAANVYPPPGHFPPTLNRRVDGPFRFWRHNLGVYCFDTWGCRVTYGPRKVWEEPATQLKPSIGEALHGLRSRMRGTQGDFKNFEGPLILEWIDKQKTSRRLELDLSRIFANGLIRHNVPEAAIRADVSVGNPDIIVEIDDRTVRLYMRALIPLAKPRDPANPLSDTIDELVPVFETVVDGASG